MRNDPLKGRRSNCPVNFAVETLGDKWTLIILRDIIFWGKHTYGEFLKSDEKIATNILANRLEHLEKEGLISKSQDPNDKRKGAVYLNALAVDDLIDSIEKNREPKLSIQSARSGLEMTLAPYYAALNGARVEFPIKNRKHPLAT